MSVRARVVAAVVAAAVLATVLFATISIVAIDRALRSTLDSQLQVTALAVADATDVVKGKPVPDADDLSQTQTLRGDTRAAIVDRAGRVLAGDRPVADISTRNEAFANATAAGEPVRIRVQPIVRGGRVVGGVLAWRSVEWIEDVDQAMLAVSIVLGLIVIALGIVFAWIAADRIVAPIDRIAALAARIEAKDLSLRLHARGTDELARLASSFDRMLDRLQAAFERERRFTADASHDLRAPLTVLRTETELALRRPRSEEEYRKALGGIAIEAERLETLVNDLLVAARAKIDAAGGGTVDLRQAAATLVARFGNMANSAGVALTMDADGGPATAMAEPNGFDRALMAILHNAIVFAETTVRVSVSARASHASIEVRDDGPGFSPDALEHATDRFWRADESRPRGGTGLGLSIARTIVEANGGTLTLENAPGGGARVSVSLRRAQGTD